MGGTVSFRITKKRKVVGFTMPDVPVECAVSEGGSTFGPRYSKPPFTIKAPPMKLQGVAKSCRRSRSTRVDWKADKVGKKK